MIIFLDNDRVLPRVKSDLTNFITQFADKFCNDIYHNPHINIYDISKSDRIPFLEPEYINDELIMKTGTLCLRNIKPSNIITLDHNNLRHFFSIYDFSKCEKEYNIFTIGNIKIKKVKCSYSKLKDTLKTNRYGLSSTTEKIRSNIIVNWEFDCEIHDFEFQLKSQDLIHKLLNISYVQDYCNYFNNENTNIYQDDNGKYDYCHSKTLWNFTHICDIISGLIYEIKPYEINFGNFGFYIDDFKQISKSKELTQKDFIYELLVSCIEKDNNGIKVILSKHLVNKMAPYHYFLIEKFSKSAVKNENGNTYFKISKDTLDKYNNSHNNIVFIILNIISHFHSLNKIDEERSYYGSYKTPCYEAFSLLNDLPYARFEQLTTIKNLITNNDFINRITDLMNIEVEYRRHVLYRTGDHEDEITYTKDIKLDLINDINIDTLSVYNQIFEYGCEITENHIEYKARKFETADRLESGHSEDYSEIYKKEITLKAIKIFYLIYLKKNNI